MEEQKGKQENHINFQGSNFSKWMKLCGLYKHIMPGLKTDFGCKIMDLGLDMFSMRCLCYADGYLQDVVKILLYSLGKILWLK